MHFEGDLDVFMDRLCELLGGAVVDPAGTVDGCELAYFHLRIVLQGLSLDAQLSFDEFVLGLHRDIFASSHRGGTGQQPGYAGDNDCAPVAGGPGSSGDAKDERDIRNESVANAKNGCASGSTLHRTVVVDHMPVVVFVTVGVPLGHRHTRTVPDAYTTRWPQFA